MGIVMERNQAKWLDTRSYPFESNFMAADGGRMHYIDTPGDQPVIFVHGWPTWSFEFRGIIRSLSRDNIRCIAPDLIGFGLSDKPENWSYSAAAQGRNIAQLVRHLDLKNVILVGHDFGGPVALSYAYEDLDRVSGLVLMNTWMWGLKQDPAALKAAKIAEGPLGRMAYLSMNAGPKLIKNMFCDRSKFTEAIQEAYDGPFLNKQDRHGVMKTAIHLDTDDAWFGELWAQRELLLEKKMMLVWGTQDPIHGEKALNRIWHEFPLAEVEQIPDCGRMLVEEHPELVAEAIRGFVHKVAA
jgi:pimeloyl-ACP methyl ester carboxylesterase